MKKTWNQLKFNIEQILTFTYKYNIMARINYGRSDLSHSTSNSSNDYDDELSSSGLWL